MNTNRRFFLAAIVAAFVLLFNVGTAFAADPPYNSPPQPEIGHPSLYVETGVPDPISGTDAHTKTWNVQVIEGTVAIVGGFTVNGESNGVYKGFGPGQISVTVTDGFLLVTKAEWGASEWCFRLGQAVQFGWAHAHEYPIQGWTCGQQAPPYSTGDSQFFPQTGHTVKGRFLAYWQQHGGLAINGYPLTDERMETLENGQTYLVQWFERTRLEYHPENQPPYDILLGQYGRKIAAIRGVDLSPAQPRQDSRFFAETGHNLRGTFRSYWEQNGGLAQFGYPISEEHQETLENGQTYNVQYFERARFQDTPGYGVELGLFGNILLNGGNQPTASNPPAPGSDSNTVTGRPRVETGPGGTKPFKAGDAVYGTSAKYNDGTPFGDVSKCYLIAQKDGTVFNGVVNPNKDEAKPCN